MKRTLLVLIIIIILIIGGFNIYKYSLYNFGNEYLKEKYPNNEFRLSFVEYHFLSGIFTSDVYCEDMEVDFIIRYDGEDTFDNFIQVVNHTKVTKFINSLAEESEWLNYVAEISISEECYDSLYTNIDLEKINYHIYIKYKTDVINKYNQFTEISYMVINTLKQKGLKFSTVRFIYRGEESRFNMLFQNIE